MGISEPLTSSPYNGISQNMVGEDPHGAILAGIPPLLFPAALWGDARPSLTTATPISRPRPPTLGLPPRGPSIGPHWPWSKGSCPRPFRFDPLRPSLSMGYASRGRAAKFS